jgi:hypothetical protein
VFTAEEGAGALFVEHPVKSIVNANIDVANFLFKIIPSRYIAGSL